MRYYLELASEADAGAVEAMCDSARGVTPTQAVRVTLTKAEIAALSRARLIEVDDTIALEGEAVEAVRAYLRRNVYLDDRHEPTVELCRLHEALNNATVRSVADVRAEVLRDVMRVFVPVTACPVCGTQPWCNIDCGMCSYMSDCIHAAVEGDDGQD